LTRSGFTLIELLVAVIVAGILGTALTRLLVNDSRFVARQEAMLSARRTARTGMNWAAVELRMVGRGGLRAAARESVTVRVPYTFGVVCGRVSGVEILSLMPSDSLSTATASPSGLAWRRNDGTWTIDNSVSSLPSNDSTTCQADSIRVVPGGRTIQVSGIPGGAPNEPPSGSLAYLFQDVAYWFAASVEIPGRTALWRKAGVQASEELVAPLDTSSGFGFLVDASMTPTPVPPADLGTVQGLELRLVGESEETPRDAAEPVEFPLVAQIRFMNWYR
jgi:prepilin-type N-terminal cleavage/methylation domain-containing protein